MDKMEHAFRTLDKFLAITSTARVYREIYGTVLSEGIYNGIINDLQDASNDYLNSKYVLKDNSLLSFWGGHKADRYDADVVDDSNDVGC